MSAKHTPGPWEIDEAGSWKDGKRTSTEYFVRKPGDDVAIASDIINPENSEPSMANAQLIAAAPDLLEAAMDLVASIQNGNGLNSIDYQKLVAAINKAKGIKP